MNEKELCSDAGTTNNASLIQSGESSCEVRELIKIDGQEIYGYQSGIDAMGDCYGIIYIAVNMINGKMYIGQTTDPYRRFYIHLYDSKNLKRSNGYFRNAINKHGWNNFNFITLDRAYSLDQLNYLEEFWIRVCGTWQREIGYNVHLGGENQFRQQSSLDRLSKSMKAYYANGGVNPRKGGTNSPKHRAATSKKLKERYAEGSLVNWLKGGHQTEEVKRKVSETKKRQYAEGSVVNHQAGKAMSEEQKEKLSKAKTKKPEKTGGALKKSQIYKGQHHSPKTEFPSVKIQCVETGKIYNSMAEAGREFNVTHANFSRAVNNPKATAAGYHWIRIET